MKFEFVEKVELELFEATKVEWGCQIAGHADNVSETYYEAGLAYCEDIVKAGLLGAHGGGCVCAVVEPGSPFATALIVISHAKARDEVRMLDIYVRPDLNLADVPPNFAILAWVAAKTIVGCLELTYKKFPSKQLKILSQVPLDKEFMTAIATAIVSMEEVAPHFKVTNQGNWIVVTKNCSGNGDDGDAGANGIATLACL